MADFTPTQHEMDQMVEGIRNMSGTLGKLFKGFSNDDWGRGRTGSGAHTGRRAQARHNQHLESNVKRFKGLGSALDETVDHLKGFGRILEGAFLGEQVASYVKNVVKTYQGLNDLGQTFGGSILGMETAAADASLPLTKFAEAMKNNGAAVANFGVKRFFDLGKSVRDNIAKFGMFGMTLDQVNELVGDYAETQRVWGQINNLNSEKSATSLADLAEESSALASLTGKNRNEMRKEMFAAERDASLRSKINQMSGSSTQQYTQNVSKALTVFAAQTGEAGSLLTRMLAQTLGKGQAIFADDAQTFFEAGAGPLVSSFDEMRRVIESTTDLTDDQLASFITNFKQQGEQLMPVLQLQQIAGNKAADQIVLAITEARKLTVEQLRAARLDQENKQVATKFLTNFENLFANISGHIRKGFFTALDKLTDWMDSDKNKALFETMGDMFEKFGTALGNFVGEILQPARLEQIGNILGSVATMLMRFGEGIFAVMSSPIVAFFIRNFTVLLSGIFSAVTSTVEFLTTLGKHFTGFSEIIADVVSLFVALFIGKKLFNVIGNWFKVPHQKLVITRGNIYVGKGRIMGGTGGGSGSFSDSGFGFGGGGGGANGNRRGFSSRAQQAAAAAEAAQAAATAGQSRAFGLGYRTANTYERAKAAVTNFPSVVSGATRRGLGGARRGLGRMRGAGGALGVGAAFAGDLALNLLPDFRGKDTLSGALEGAGTGATIGTIVGMLLGPLTLGISLPVATAIGAGLGGLTGAILANRDPNAVAATPIDPMTGLPERPKANFADSSVIDNRQLDAKEIAILNKADTEDEQLALLKKMVELQAQNNMATEEQTLIQMQNEQKSRRLLIKNNQFLDSIGGM